VANELARQLAQLIDPALLPVLDRIDAGTATADDLQAVQAWPAAHRAQVARAHDDKRAGAVAPAPQAAAAGDALERAALRRGDADRRAGAAALATAQIEAHEDRGLA
jgi:hypothetical protein